MSSDNSETKVLEVLSHTSSADITDQEAEFFNSLPMAEVLPILKNIMNTHANEWVTSRAFDAIMKHRQADKVAFLIDVYKNSNDNWKSICCELLGDYQDSRAIAMLCEILLHGSDSLDRWKAAESLSIIGDSTAIPALEYAKANDKEVDYEIPIADICEKALQKIYGRILKN